MPKITCCEASHVLLNPLHFIQMQSETAGRRRTRRLKKKTTTKRPPLTDITNARPSSSYTSYSSTSSLLSHLKKPRFDPKSSSPPTPILEDSSIPGVDDASSPPRPPSRENESFLVSGVNRSESEPLIVYSRSVAKGKRSKGKEPQTTTSCPPVERIRSTNGGKSVGGANTGRRKASSVPSSKPKKMQRCVEGSDADSLEEQRLYFMEVDAFELSVEFVEEKDLE